MSENPKGIHEDKKTSVCQESGGNRRQRNLERCVTAEAETVWKARQGCWVLSVGTEGPVMSVTQK